MKLAPAHPAIASRLATGKAKASKKPFAVFDIDGTLIRWQLYHVLADKLAKKELLGPRAKERLHEARMKWKRREHTESFSEYERVLISTFEAALRSLKPSDVDEIVDEIIEEYKYQVYTYTRDLITDLKNSGYVLLAISGSQQELVTRIAEHYGFDDIVGTSYLRGEEGFTGEKIIGSHNKEKVLKDLVQKHNLSYRGSVAIGDSLSDAAMLRLVEQPIAFNPDKNLFGIAHANGWKIVVERKNVIYELESKDGSYVLA